MHCFVISNSNKVEKQKEKILIEEIIVYFIFLEINFKYFDVF